VPSDIFLSTLLAANPAPKCPINIIQFLDKIFLSKNLLLFIYPARILFNF